MSNFIQSYQYKWTNLVGFVPSFLRIKGELQTIVNFERELKSAARTVWVIKTQGVERVVIWILLQAHNHHSNLIQNWLDWIHYNQRWELYRRKENSCNLLRYVVPYYSTSVSIILHHLVSLLDLAEHSAWVTFAQIAKDPKQQHFFC